MAPETSDGFSVTQSPLEEHKTGLGARAFLRGVTTGLAVLILLLGSGAALSANWSKIFPPPPYGGAVVVGFAARSGDDALEGLRGDTGHVLWSKPWPNAIDDTIWTYPGQHTIYVNTTSGLLYAIDPQSGHILWRSAVAVIGSSASVASIAGADADYLLVAFFPQGAIGQRGVVLLNRTTGQTIWQQSVPDLDTATLSAGVLIVTRLLVDPQATQVPNTNLQRWDVRTGQLLWQVTMPASAGCQVVSAAFVSCSANLGVSGTEHYSFLDAATGLQLWQHDSLFLTYASATLAIFVDPINNTNLNQFSAYTIQDGRPLWQRTVLYGDSFPLPPDGEGTSDSSLPGVAALFVTSLHSPPESSTGVAAMLDLHDGQTLWQNPDLQLNFIIPIATTATTLYALSNTTAFYALRLADGRINWSVPMDLHEPLNDLIWADDGQLFAFSGMQTELIDGASGKVRWQVAFGLHAMVVIAGY